MALTLCGSALVDAGAYSAYGVDEGYGGYGGYGSHGDSYAAPVRNRRKCRPRKRKHAYHTDDYAHDNAGYGSTSGCKPGKTCGGSSKGCPAGSSGCNPSGKVIYKTDTHDGHSGSYETERPTTTHWNSDDDGYPQDYIDNGAFPPTNGQPWPGFWPGPTNDDADADSDDEPPAGHVLMSAIKRAYIKHYNEAVKKLQAKYNANGGGKNDYHKELMELDKKELPGNLQYYLLKYRYDMTRNAKRMHYDQKKADGSMTKEIEDAYQKMNKILDAAFEDQRDAIDMNYRPSHVELPDDELFV